MSIKAALLDAPASSGKGVYLRIDELPGEAALTDRHVPQITECDLPANEYVWVPNDNDPPGAFWPKAWVERAWRMAELKREAEEA